MCRAQSVRHWPFLWLRCCVSASNVTVSSLYSSEYCKRTNFSICLSTSHGCEAVRNVRNKSGDDERRAESRIRESVEFGTALQSHKESCQLQQGSFFCSSFFKDPQDVSNSQYRLRSAVRRPPEIVQYRHHRL